MHNLYQSFLSSWSKRGAYSAAFFVAAALSLGACSFGSGGLSSSWANDTETALSQSRWYDAETLLQQGYANNPSDMYVLNNLGLVYQKTGRTDLARQYYERVISSNTEESRTAYGQELRRIAQTNLDTLRGNPFGVPNLPNTRPATGAAATATATLPTSQVGGLNLPVLPLPTAGAQPTAPRPTAMVLPDLTPPAPRPQATPAAPPAPPAPAPVAAVPTPATSGVTTTVVQGQNRTTGAATAAGVIGASTSAAAATAGRISAQTGTGGQPSIAVQAEISSELQKWATAWVDKDLPTYYGHYVPEFKGANADNKAWRAAREQVIASRKAIQLELKDLKFNSAGQDRVTVDMIQNYQSDALKDSIKKSMTFVKQGSRWLIQSESNR
jgi:hypothetical protein